MNNHKDMKNKCTCSAIQKCPAHKEQRNQLAEKSACSKEHNKDCGHADKKNGYKK